MYIEKGNANEIPKGAIRLTRSEVVEYMDDLIRKWPSTIELWALKFGNPIQSCGVVLSSTLILHYYRDKLKLRGYGRFTLFIPVVFIPSIFNQLYQSTTTTRSIILQEDCPTCIFTQAMFLQIGTGIFYPWFSSVGGCYMLANKMGTYTWSSSNISAAFKEYGMHFMKISRPIYNRLTVFVIGHVLLSYAITHYQMENFEFLRFKMLQQQNEEIENLQQMKANKNK